MTAPLPCASLSGTRRARLRRVVVLGAAYLAVSLAMELVLVLQSVDGIAVDGAVWGRCSAVLASTSCPTSRSAPSPRRGS